MQPKRMVNPAKRPRQKATVNASTPVRRYNITSGVKANVPRTVTIMPKVRGVTFFSIEYHHLLISYKPCTSEVLTVKERNTYRTLALEIKLLFTDL